MRLGYVWAHPGSPAVLQAAPLQVDHAEASSSQETYSAAGAIDGDRFATAWNKLWKGASGQSHWEWQADFGKCVKVGSILQILGDNETYLTAAPLTYVWQSSDDGNQWHDIDSTKTPAEHRMYRIFRLAQPVSARYLRMTITGTGNSEPPALREVEFYERPDATIEFPDWVYVVSTTDVSDANTCSKYLTLARSCPEWSRLLGQGIWHGDFDPAMVTDEPQPICAFFTGSSRDWCQVDRLSWRGTEAVLKANMLPMWAACGGGQVLGILSDQGCEEPWDCPKCRDPNHPKLPIYGHIGLIDPTKETQCGDYSNNIYEKGPTPVHRLVDDPVFRGLPDDFLVPEFHCGQLEYLPAGWDLIVTKGKGGKTWMQCMRKRGTCIYAVQFHIENEGSCDVSELVMSNYLACAKDWWRQKGSSQTAAASQPDATRLVTHVDSVAEPRSN
jgi:hypothetical protein